jgi:hypothetical protein
MLYALRGEKDWLPFKASLPAVKRKGTCSTLPSHSLLTAELAEQFVMTL